MKEKLVYAVTGFFVGNLIVGSLVFGIYYLAQNRNSHPKVSFDEAITLLQSGRVKEVTLGDDQIVFSLENESRVLKGPPPLTEGQTELLINMVNSPDRGRIKLTEQQQSSGVGWLVMVNALPFILLATVPTVIIIILLSLILLKMGSNNKLG